MSFNTKFKILGMPFFSIGPMAYGFIAIGQLSCGIICVGQISVGVINVSQVGIGVISLNQLGASLLIALGMAVFAPASNKAGFYKIKLPGKNPEITSYFDSFNLLLRDIKSDSRPILIWIAVWVIIFVISSYIYKEIRKKQINRKIYK